VNNGLVDAIESRIGALVWTVCEDMPPGPAATDLTEPQSITLLRVGREGEPGREFRGEKRGAGGADTKVPAYALRKHEVGQLP
jgi:hypothetical protein